MTPMETKITPDSVISACKTAADTSHSPILRRTRRC